MLKCVNGNCSKKALHFEVSPKNAIIPTDCQVSDLRKLFAFFQYQAPNISSYTCSSLEQNRHEELLDEMFKSWKTDQYDFVAHNVTIDNALNTKKLHGKSICNYCKRFICKRKQRNKKTGYRETDLECLLRHLRNSLAHGRVFIIHGGNYISILFEDVNNDGKISARIICNRADLKKWRELIISEIAENKEGEIYEI